jgi:HD-like signal output (HDOD) protein/CheY-like chemotaxis protein
MQVLFVDDDPAILSGMRRMMHATRADWTCLFAASGQEALDRLAAEPVDVVVSDMRMPGMDGATLLGRVKDLRPQAVRIVLSGQPGDESVLRAVGPAHQYLSKPCDATVLASVIARALALRAILHRRDLRQVVGALGGLPSPPDRLQKLMAEIDSPTASAASVAAQVERDVAMLAELLRMTNSQYFGLPRAVSTAQEAVRALGTETIRALAYQVGLFQVFQGGPAMSGVIAAIGERGLEMSAHCRVIAQRRGLPQDMIDLAGCAGMLWEIGLLVLIDRWPERMTPVLAAVARGASPTAAVEAAFSATQGEIGAYLLGLWGFNDLVVEALAYLETDTSPSRMTASLLPILRDARRQIQTPLVSL